MIAQERAHAREMFGSKDRTTNKSRWDLCFAILVPVLLLQPQDFPADLKVLPMLMTDKLCEAPKILAILILEFY